MNKLNEFVYPQSKLAPMFQITLSDALQKIEKKYIVKFYAEYDKRKKQNFIKCDRDLDMNIPINGDKDSVESLAKTVEKYMEKSMKESDIPSFDEHVSEAAVYSINHHTVKMPKVSNSEDDKSIAVKIEKIISKLLGVKYFKILIEANNKVPSFEEHVNEAELETQEIDKVHFPNPVTGVLKRIFKKKGKKDGNEHDDDVKTVPVSIEANKLKPSQDAIYLSKSLAMAVGGVEGGDLGAIISKDNYILDGHHRWAATMFNNPKAKVKGYQADLNIGDLIPVLRALGDAFDNDRRGEPKGGDVNIFDASDKDIEAAIAGQNMNPKFYNEDKGEEWLKDKGGIAQVGSSLALIQSVPPPSDAEPRTEMPVIDADKGEVKKAAKLLNRGAIDVRKPYAEGIK